MLIRLSVMVVYAAADERIQMVFTSVLFYCSQVKKYTYYSVACFK